MSDLPSPYRLSPSELVRVAALEYFRSFWWYVAIVPAFGVIALIFGDNFLRAIGMMAMLWPLSIPARAVFSTAKARKLFGAGVRARVEEDGLYIVPIQADTKGLRLKWPTVRDVVKRDNWALVRTRRFGFVPVPPEVGREVARRLAEMRESIPSP